MMRGAEYRVSILRVPIFCRAYVIHESATEDDANAIFRALVADAMKESSRQFILDDPEEPSGANHHDEDQEPPDRNLQPRQHR
jgi:hypothetical protein